MSAATMATGVSVFLSLSSLKAVLIHESSAPTPLKPENKQSILRDSAQGLTQPNLYLAQPL
eukprot:11604391-Alexandrium_andersonii.AAC.1